MYTIKNLRSRKTWKNSFASYDKARSFLRSYIKKVRNIAVNSKHIAISEYGFGITKLG